MTAPSGAWGPDAPPLVVDASVAIKWLVPEVLSAEALRLLDDDAPPLHAPDLLLAEVGNIAWKKARRGEIGPDLARRIVRLIARGPLVIHPAAPLLEAAYEIAEASGRTVYDSLYVALAVRIDGRMITADDRLARALAPTALGPRVAPLSGVPARGGTT